MIQTNSADQHHYKQENVEFDQQSREYEDIQDTTQIRRNRSEDKLEELGNLWMCSKSRGKSVPNSLHNQSYSIR